MAIETEFTYDLARFISFRDLSACDRVRRIRRSELATHPNPEFRIRIVDEPTEFYGSFAEDMVSRIRAARDEERHFVAILPVGPMPQYALAARMINEERLSLAHVHTFNMDEYANEDGVTAPVSWPGSFQRAMLDRFFALVDDPDPELGVRMHRQLAPADPPDALARLGVTKADEPRQVVGELGLAGQRSSFHGSRRRVVPLRCVRQGTKPSAYVTPHCCPRKRLAVFICSTMSTSL